MFGHLEIRKGKEPGFVETKYRKTSWWVWLCEMIIPETRIIPINKVNTVAQPMLGNLKDG